MRINAVRMEGFSITIFWKGYGLIEDCGPPSAGYSGPRAMPCV